MIQFYVKRKAKTVYNLPILAYFLSVLIIIVILFYICINLKKSEYEYW
jgi:hypothetical protein